MVVAIIALVVACSGTAIAAVGLVSGDSLIKKHSLSGNRLRNHTLIGKQINLSKLGTVPSATHATSASTAGSATPTGTAGGALNGRYPSPSLAAPEPWHEVGASGQPAFHSPWKNHGGSFTTAGFYKDPLGIVHLKGAVNGTTTGTVFTLPAGYAPARDVTEVVGKDSGGYLLEICGSLELDGCGAGGAVTVLNSNGTNENVYLDGVTFRVGE